MHTRPLRGVLIGAGAVTQYHLTAWKQIPQASIVAIADPDIEAAIERGDEFGIPRQNIYSSFAALLDGETDLDYADIASPPGTHPELVKQAARNGLHITCQKPFAYTLKEAQQMIDLCKRAEVLLNINENWRWRSWYRQIKQLLDNNTIGSPVYAKFFIHSDYWVKSDQNSRLRKRAHGTFFEWGIHHIDLLRYLFGEIESVYGWLHHRFSDLPHIDQMALVVLHFRSGLMAYIDMSSASFSPRGNVNREGPMVEDTRIEGDRGTVELLNDPVRGDLLRVVTRDQSIELPAYSGAPLAAYQASYTAAQQHFVDCLLSGRLPETHAQDNLETLAVALAAYQSAQTHQVVTVEAYKRLNL